MRGSNYNFTKYHTMIISIHASTWEAALTPVKASVDFLISIHASTWEAAISKSLMLFSVSISIHSSTWEAAPSVLAKTIYSINFNSRLYMRGSADTSKSICWFPDFNSRLYMRGSDIKIPYALFSLNFNSRLYMRGSITNLRLQRVRSISIHASTWEAAYTHFIKSFRLSYFNSRLYMRGSQCKSREVLKV